MPNTNPRVSADEIRIRLDAAAQEPPFDPNKTERWPTQPQNRPDPAPDLSSKPPAGSGIRLSDNAEVYALAIWESMPLPGGDCLILARIPEPLVQSLSSEAEHLQLSLGEMLKDLLTRASEYGWR